MMDFRDIVEGIEDDLEHDRPEKAQIMAQLAIAERLDRLCEILSSRKGKW